MKGKLFIIVAAMLAFGLVLMGCPNPQGPGTNPKPNPETGLKPWTPAPIDPPTSGFKAFPKDQLLENYTSYAGEGDVAYMVEDEKNPGTYNVEIRTKPGGISLLAFNGADFLYRKGYYLSLELPEKTDHKPTAALTFAAVGKGETGANWDSSPYRVNMSETNAIIDDTVYLSGRVDFAWNDPEFIQGPFRTVVLYLYWGADETVGDYKFSVKKLLITEGDDVTPPKYPNVSWTPEPVAEPAGYVALSEAEMLKATFFAGDGVIPAGSITKNANGTYKVTIKTRPGDKSQVCFIADDLNFEAYYLSINIPPESAHKVTRVYTWMSTTKGDGGITWPTVVDHNPGNPYYISGKVDSQWNSEENTSMFKTAGLWLYWHEDEVAGDFEFTVNTLKVFEFGGELPDPNQMTAWTPDPVAAPTGWDAFPADTAAATFYPGWGNPKIEPKDGGGYTVTLRVRDQKTDPGHSFIRIPAKDVAFQGGYYLSVTLPNQTVTSTMKPSRFYAYALNGSVGNWNSAIEYDQRTTNKWIQGKVEGKYEHAEFTRHDLIEIQIWWHSDAVGDQDYVFTIDKFLAKEETSEGPSAEVPVIHDSSKLDNAVYITGATAAALEVVPNWTNNSGSYTYEWYSNTVNSNTGGTLIPSATGTSFTPPTNVNGTFYYYVVLTFGSEKTTSKAIRIIVNETGTLPPELLVKVNGVRSYLQNAATYGGTWDNQYNQDPFGGNFIGTAPINYTSGAIAVPAVFDQFVIEVQFTDEALGKDYEFTISNLSFIVNSANVITEANILNGARAGSGLNGWAQQANVVTKGSGSDYKVRMTIIKEEIQDWGNGGAVIGEYCLARLVIPVANTENVSSYGFNASLPSVFVE